MEKMTKEISEMQLRLEHLELKASIVEARNRLRAATDIEQTALKGRKTATKTSSRKK